MKSEENQTTSFFRNNAGQHIFYRCWPSDAEPKGIVVIVHGLNSHSGYYDRFASQLVENGYGSYAIDLRGRGMSEGERYYISNYEDVIDDLDQLLEIVKAAHPTIPIFLLGHSAGGVFASVYAVDRQEKLNGLICESFAFRLPAPRIALAVVEMLGYIIPHVKLIRLKNDDFSRDRVIVETMDNDPLLAGERQPARTMQQLFGASAYLKDAMPRLNMPILIMHGTADHATSPDGSIYMMEHVASVDKQLKLYEGYYHDLLNDKYNGIIVKDIIRWLNERV